MPKLTKGMEIASRFVISDKLGGGANGEVWKALDKHGKRDVAIKVLLDAGPDELKRLLHEAQQWMKLEHENIVRIYDIRTEDAMLVMECLEGGTLEGLIKSKALTAGGFSPVRPCPTPEATKILTDILRGLSYAHEQGILHRDLKPGNILLSKFGTAKITDFGMAREEKDGVFFLSPHLNRPGMSGTPEYMSPEAARGEDADRQSDIFSAGIVAYQLFTGRHPFSHPSGVISPRQLIASEQIESPVIREIQPDTPDKLADVVSKMLIKNKARRYKTVRDILAELGDQGVGLPCSNCDVPNPSENKYCGHCGELLDKNRSGVSTLGEIETADELVAEGFDLARQENWIGAIRKYEEAIKKDPAHQKAYASLGYSLNHLGRYDDAIQQLNKGLELGEHHSLYAYRAFSYKILARYDDAISDYDRALELRGRDSRYFKGKADCLLELGDDEKAYSTVLYALRFDPRNEWLLSLKSRIERTRPEFSGGPRS